MARPTKPKDIKPKSEGELATLPTAVPGGGGGLDLKFLITLGVILISTALTSAASVYFLAPMVLMPPIDQKLAKIAAAAPDGQKQGDGGGDAAAAHAQKVGMNLELDEFTVNLKEDPSSPGAQYLRAKMSLNIAVPPEEDCYNVKKAEAFPQRYPQSVDGGQVLGAAAPIITNAAAPIITHAFVSPLDRTLLAEGGEGGGDPVAACLGKFKNNMSKFVPTMRDVINAALMKRTAGTLSTLEGQEALKDEIKDSINQFMGEPYQVVRLNFEDFIIQK